MVCGAKLQDPGLNMDILDHSEDEEERSQYYGSGGKFGARRQKARSKSHQQLLLMDSVGNGNGNGVDVDGASEEEIVPLPEYERLSQSARLPEDPDPKNPLLPEYRVASPPPPPPLPSPPRQQKKPAAWRLIEYVRSRHKSGVPGGCGSSDGDSKSSDGEKEVEDGGSEDGKKEDKNKKRSSWLPDRERRWPVQGFY